MPNDGLQRTALLPRRQIRGLSEVWAIGTPIGVEISGEICMPYPDTSLETQVYLIRKLTPMGTEVGI